MSNSNSLDNYKESGEPPSQLTGGQLSASATDSAGATPVFHAVGALAGATTTITPGAPANMVAGMVEFFWVETQDQAVSLTTPNGFTEVPGSPVSVPNATATIATRGTVYWRRYTGTASSPITNDPGDHVIGRRIAISGCVPTGTPWDFIQVSSEALETRTGSATGNSTFDDNRLILILGGASKPDSNSTAEFNSIFNPNLVGLTERADQASTAGNGGHLWAVTGEKLVSGSVGDTRYVKVNPAYKWHFVIALKPPDIVSSEYEESVSVSRKESLSDRGAAGALAGLSIGEREGFSNSFQNSIGQQVSINQLTGFNNSAGLGMFSVVNLADRLGILHGVNISAQSIISLGEREGLSSSSILNAIASVSLSEREGLSASANLTVGVAALIAERLGITSSVTVAIFPIVNISERDGLSMTGNLVVASNASLNKRLFVVTENSVDTDQIVAIVQTLSSSLGISASAQANMLASLPISERVGISEGVSQLMNSGLGLGATYSILTLSDTNVIIVSGFGYVFTQDSSKYLTAPSDTSSSVETGDE